MVAVVFQFPEHVGHAARGAMCFDPRPEIAHSAPVHDLGQRQTTAREAGVPQPAELVCLADLGFEVAEAQASSAALRAINPAQSGVEQAGGGVEAQAYLGEHALDVPGQRLLHWLATGEDM